MIHTCTHTSSIREVHHAGFGSTGTAGWTAEPPFATNACSAMRRTHDVVHVMHPRPGSCPSGCAGTLRRHSPGQRIADEICRGTFVRACGAGARDRGRTGKAQGPADFTYHCSFRYRAPVARFVVWTIPLPYAVRQLGRGRLVSTLSHVLHGFSSGLPSARPVKGSPNLTPFHPRVSPWRTPTSPLRLPIPPPGQCESAE